MSTRIGIPLWLKIAYTAWLVFWIPTYWIQSGPANFLWLCDVANFIIAVAIWRESSLLFSSQTVSVLIIQLVWIVDVAGRLVLGFHPVGGTEYMFAATQPPVVKLLSLFHAWMPVLLLWAISRLGYDRRGWRLQTLIAWLVLPASFFADPERNLNWLWEPFGVPQTVMPPLLYLLVCMFAYPLLLYLPTHALLSLWFSLRSRRKPHSEGAR